MHFDQITLPNGLRIIGEYIPHFRSVAVGLWIGAGSQYETRAQAGMSHYIEHMVFKGTKTRSARDIAEQMDEVGGHLNAFTSKECTCFYAKVVDEHVRLAMDIISDLCVNPVFDPAEMEKEKGVVLEEIDMAEDTPEDLVHELLMLAHFGDQPVARPILGAEDTVTGYMPTGSRCTARKTPCWRWRVAISGSRYWIWPGNFWAAGKRVRSYAPNFTPTTPSPHSCDAIRTLSRPISAWASPD